MIDTTTTNVSTFQVVDPIIVPPPGTDPLAYVESGFTNLTQGVQTLSVTFQTAKISDYVLVEAEIQNISDAAPVNFDWEVTAKSLTGFTIQLSGLPDSGNYYFRWRVGIPPS